MSFYAQKKIKIEPSKKLLFQNAETKVIGIFFLTVFANSDIINERPQCVNKCCGHNVFILKTNIILIQTSTVRVGVISL